MKSSTALLVMIGIGTMFCIGCGGSGLSNGGSGQQASCGSGTCGITAGASASGGASAAPSTTSGWPCFVTVYQSGQIGGLATGSGSSTSQSPNATCGLGAAPTGGSAFSCYVEPTGQTQPSLGWCLLNGSGASPSPVSSTPTNACAPSTTTSAVQLSVPCLTLTVGQTQSVTVSESGYGGRFLPSVANGAIASSGINSTQNNTFTFTGASAGTTTATFSDTSGHSATMQIVVNAASGSSPAPSASSSPSLAQIVPTTSGSASSGLSCPTSVQQGSGSTAIVSCGTGTAPAGAISPCFITSATGALVSGWCLP